jgi:hypothetical protein
METSKADYYIGRILNFKEQLQQLNKDATKAEELIQIIKDETDHKFDNDLDTCLQAFHKKNIPALEAVCKDIINQIKELQ